VGLLSNIAKRIKGHDCEQIVKKTGNEITLSGAAIEVGPAKINIGAFANKVVELIKATEIAVNLDQAQYLVCKAKNSSSDSEFRIRCERIHLQIILSLTQLRSLFEAIKIDPSPENRKELVEWIRYCGSLNKHAIQTLNPGTTTMGPEDQELEDIMKYQGIDEQDMKEALQQIE
jgi:hypothetical protein